MILAIDPGLKTSGTGLAILSDDEKVLKTFFIPPMKKEASFHERSTKLIEKIIDLVPDWMSMQTIVVETNRYMGLANIMHLKTLGALDYLFGIEVIHAMTVKKQVTGSGKAQKTDIRQYLQQYYAHADQFKKIMWEQEDTVDAVAIGLAWLRKCRKEIE